MSYQPKTGQKCSCRRGIERDNCPTCEGTGWVIDFAKIRKAVAVSMAENKIASRISAPSAMTNCTNSKPSENNRAHWRAMRHAKKKDD